MDTKVVKLNMEQELSSQVKEAAKLILEGQVVAFPTETVYGLGGSGWMEDALDRIYAAKGRPSDNPLILHVSNQDMVKELAVDISPLAQKAMDEFWPGPLTVILPKSEKVPNRVTGGLETVAIRMPRHKVALALIEEAKVPIAAPSANTSGRPSPTMAEHVAEDLNGKIPMILDGGKVTVGVESTIVDFTSENPIVLRPGKISRDELEDFLGVPVYLHQKKEDGVPKAPGMKYKHYAPKAHMIMVTGDAEAVTKKINDLTKEQQQQGHLVGVIATQESKNEYIGDVVVSLGSRQRMEEVVSNLYECIRKFDHTKVDVIYTEGFEGEVYEEAIMNRLLKACGQEVIQT